MKWLVFALLLPLVLACPAPSDGTVDGGDVPVPLETTITEGPAAFHPRAEAILLFSATQPAATFECSLDGAAFSACTSPLTLSALSEAAHAFEVRAVTADELDNTPAKSTFTVDLTPPDTVLQNRPLPLSKVPSATLAFISTEEGAGFQCRLDAEPFSGCTSPRSYNGLTEGPHVFEVAAVDRAGNVDPTPSAYDWTVDVAPPETTFDSGPPEPLPGPVATFVFSSDDASATFECSVDDAPFTACTSPLKVDPGSGAHTLQVRAVDTANNRDATPASWDWSVAPGHLPLRVIAANLTSGNLQSYDPGEGLRILQALTPDVVLLQEFRFKANTPADFQELTETALGIGGTYAREEFVSLPNGILSRFPILESGVWDDPRGSNREFLWARIDLPGPKDLWAISLHLLTSNATDRSIEADALVEYIQDHVPVGDYLVLGGDLNTNSRSETAITGLSQITVTAGPHPVDNAGEEGTNRNRDKPYDWVLADPDLHPLQISTVIGSNTFPAGLVFDSSVYSPLSEVPPVQLGDSAATSMQHMAVVKDYSIPW